MKTMRRLLSTATLALMPMPALAGQEGTAADEPSKAEEIVVYGRGEQKNSLATGLDLSPRETPQSISIITREQLDDQASINIADALSYTTGVSVKALDRARYTLAARGFEITSFQFDGAPFFVGNLGLEENNTAIFERIEVMRGANGLLQGVGEPSATINLVRKHATSRDLTGVMSLEAGSWGRIAANGDITTPLAADGAVRGRLVAQVYSQDSFVDLEQSKGYVVYGVIDADLGATTRVSLGASYQQDDFDGLSFKQLPYWYSDGTRTAWPRSKATAARWSRFDTTVKTAFLTLEQQLGSDWSLRSDLSYQQKVEDMKMLLPSGYPERSTGLGMVAAPYWYERDSKQWGASASIKGGFDLLGRQHQLIVGAMYSHMKSTGFTNRDPDPATIAPIDNFDDWDGSYPEPRWGDPYRLNGAGTTEQYAIYGVTRLQLAKPLKLIAGARMSWWRRDEEVARYTPIPFTLREDAIFTPYAGLILDVTGNLSAYVSYSRIFNPQNSQDRNGDYLPPVQGANYEAGLKGEWMNGRLRASAAIFRIEQDNFAVVDGSNPDTGKPFFRPARGTVSKGYEGEIAGKILPGWDLSLGWSAFTAKDVDGLPVQPAHPGRVLRMSTRYDFGGGLDGFSLGGSLRWESRPPMTAVNPGTQLTEKVGQPAYLLVNGMAQYAFNKRVSLQVNLDNLFDKHYYNNDMWSDGFVFGKPRNVRVTLRYGF